MGSTPTHAKANTRAHAPARAAPIVDAGVGEAGREQIRAILRAPSAADAEGAAALAPRASGAPLDTVTRADMEARFGHPLGGVRVHTGAEAAASAAAIGARAYTVGSDIVFGERRFAPSTTDGQRLLAHEIAHVVQQSESGPARGPALEAEARAAARAAMEGTSPIHVALRSGPMLACELDAGQADSATKVTAPGAKKPPSVPPPDPIEKLRAQIKALLVARAEILEQQRKGFTAGPTSTGEKSPEDRLRAIEPELQTLLRDLVAKLRAKPPPLPAGELTSRTDPDPAYIAHSRWLSEVDATQSELDEVIRARIKRAREELTNLGGGAKGATAPLAKAVLDEKDEGDKQFRDIHIVTAEVHAKVHRGSVEAGAQMLRKLGQSDLERAVHILKRFQPKTLAAIDRDAPDPRVSAAIAASAAPASSAAAAFVARAAEPALVAVPARWDSLFSAGVRTKPIVLNLGASKGDQPTLDNVSDTTPMAPLGATQRAVIEAVKENRRAAARLYGYGKKLGLAPGDKGFGYIYGGSGGVKPHRREQGDDKELLDALGAELVFEGGTSAINAYDRAKFSFGMGYALSGALEDVMDEIARKPGVEALLAQYGLRWEHRLLWVLNVDRGTIESGSDALALLRGSPDLLSAFIHLGEGSSTGQDVADVQWAHFAKRMKPIMDLAKEEKAKGTPVSLPNLRVAAHMKWWRGAFDAVGQSTRAAMKQKGPIGLWVEYARQRRGEWKAPAAPRRKKGEKPPPPPTPDEIAKNAAAKAAFDDAPLILDNTVGTEAFSAAVHSGALQHWGGGEYGLAAFRRECPVPLPLATGDIKGPRWARRLFIIVQGKREPAGYYSAKVPDERGAQTGKDEVKDLSAHFSLYAEMTPEVVLKWMGKLWMEDLERLLDAYTKKKDPKWRRVALLLIKTLLQRSGPKGEDRRLGTLLAEISAGLGEEVALLSAKPERPIDPQLWNVFYFATKDGRYFGDPDEISPGRAPFDVYQLAGTPMKDLLTIHMPKYARGGEHPDGRRVLAAEAIANTPIRAAALASLVQKKKANVAEEQRLHDMVPMLSREDAAAVEAFLGEKVWNGLDRLAVLQSKIVEGQPPEKQRAAIDYVKAMAAQSRAGAEELHRIYKANKSRYEDIPEEVWTRGLAKK